MKQILILNFKRNGDIFSTAHLINSLRRENPEAMIHLAIYREFLAAAESLLHVHKIHTIDRELLALYKRNPLFSPAYAINNYYSALEPILNQHWTQVINYSNDYGSSYLIGLLQADSVVGPAFDSQLILKNDNTGSLFFNDVMTQYPFPTLHFVDSYHQMLGLNFQLEDLGLKSNPANNQLAFENIESLRKRVAINPKVFFIIGIQLRSSKAEKDLSIPMLQALVSEILKDENFYPLLLMAPNSQADKEIANILNAHFDNSLLTVESDFLALTSVLMNIDILLTPDTAIKHIADLVQVPVIEICKEASSFLKQSSVQKGNLIIDSRSKTEDYGAENFTAKDLLELVRYRLGLKDIKDLYLSPQVKVYEIKHVGPLIPIQIAGEIDADFEITQKMALLYLQQILKFPITADDATNPAVLSPSDIIVKYLTQNFSKAELSRWIDTQKEVLGEVAKGLLTTLKSLVLLRNSSQHPGTFFQNLDHLLSFCDSKTILAIPLLLLQARLSVIESKDKISQFKKIESLLYQLKNEIHSFTSSITLLTNPPSPKKQEANGVQYARP